jgi:hypothetical protein
MAFELRSKASGLFGSKVFSETDGISPKRPVPEKDPEQLVGQFFDGARLHHRATLGGMAKMAG